MISSTQLMLFSLILESFWQLQTPASSLNLHGLDYLVSHKNQLLIKI